MFVVDTNVLIYGVNKDAPDHIRCRELLESLRAQTTPWYVTWGIVYEFLRVVTHPRVLTRPYTSEQAWTFLNALFSEALAGLLGKGLAAALLAPSHGAEVDIVLETDQGVDHGLAS